MTLMRIEIIKRRRNAMQKYLRSDIAELLKIGHDSDAYGRAGRLYLDENRSLCYDLAARYCVIISEQLTTINNQSECPEECKEAVSSLMYAAARFGDLPELRKLRDLFFERYGNLLESFVNKEFAGLLKPDRPTKDINVRFMQEIAQEYGVEWHPDSLDNKLYNPYPSIRDWSGNVNDDQDKESHITDRESGLMISIQETRSDDDSNARKTDESNIDIIKQTENVRQRIKDYWSRTSSLLSTSRETSTSPEESSTPSDDSTKSRPFFDLRLMPPPYVKSDPKTDVNKENGDDKTIATTPRTMKNRWWRKVGTLPRSRLHPVECLSNTRAIEETKGNARGSTCQSDLTVVPPMGHVHPKLPSYDEIIARFRADRAKTEL